MNNTKLSIITAVIIGALGTQQGWSSILMAVMAGLITHFILWTFYKIESYLLNDKALSKSG